ncbi:hypothetical protein SAMD00019534_071140 [Acytostelium subglobosum LB1]|uniref:hypothetical protein n=1 Tax=Acytostelium subglobosum LB1 TaxID=1410327 RepID=UPI0006449991|nr:hypothetical protein SAMD00019534_071140 [Acytostelium subglobosum LB1]GAM23939.1 hypothetical protein SAMD00019534_071140 [Acytostelium subglobosum LB1]|eukprot:XP_012752975.1 hypothetical protein SAMD00019534_071140 [Acytostelium subglobosum LB1]
MDMFLENITLINNITIQLTSMESLKAEPTLENGRWSMSIPSTYDKGRILLPLLLSKSLHQRFPNMTESYLLSFVRFITLPSMLASIFKHLKLEQYIPTVAHKDTSISSAERVQMYNTYLLSLIGQMCNDKDEQYVENTLLPLFTDYLDKMSDAEFDHYHLTKRTSLVDTMPNIDIDRKPLPAWFPSLCLSILKKADHLQQLNHLLSQHGYPPSHSQLIQETSRGSRGSLFFYVLYAQQNESAKPKILGYGAGPSTKQAKSDAATDSLIRLLYSPKL